MHVGHALAVKTITPFVNVSNLVAPNAVEALNSALPVVDKMENCLAGEDNIGRGEALPRRTVQVCSTRLNTAHSTSRLRSSGPATRRLHVAAGAASVTSVPIRRRSTSVPIPTDTRLEDGKKYDRYVH